MFIVICQDPQEKGCEDEADVFVSKQEDMAEAFHEAEVAFGWVNCVVVTRQGAKRLSESIREELEENP
jgi:hypothetical protein